MHLTIWSNAVQKNFLEKSGVSLAEFNSKES
jgi:hypothetical protein